MMYIKKALGNREINYCTSCLCMFPRQLEERNRNLVMKMAGS